MSSSDKRLCVRMITCSPQAPPPSGCRPVASRAPASGLQNKSSSSSSSSTLVLMGCMSAQRACGEQQGVRAARIWGACPGEGLSSTSWESSVSWAHVRLLRK